MKDVLLLLAHLLTITAKLLGPGGVKAVLAENLLLKQQLLIVCRPRRRAPNLSTVDRFLLAFWSLFLRPSRIAKTAVGIRPSTLLRFHQCLVHRKYRALFSPRNRGRPGPRGPSQELIRAIVELKRRNLRFGCPRIALIISQTFGVGIDKNVVRRVLAKHYHLQPGGGGPSWLTFLGHMKDSLWSVHLFRCESITLRSHWVMVVMDHFTRRIIGFSVHAGHVDGGTLCRMFNKAISGMGTPRYLSSDNDPLFEFHRWKANLRMVGVEEIKTVPYVPLSHPFVERLIGTIRREFLDHVLFWNSVDLERKLQVFAHYYDRHRVHASLGGDTPAEVSGETITKRAELNHFRWHTHCCGLVQLPLAA
ncbi:MAG: integrase core domain-containing protein [Gammaproteobacteria bacterium]|nr:integrase core domain-containing protein [Gammaproteobacteria bacterium]